MVFNKIVTFLAEWDESEGPKIIDIYPESKKLELEEITMQIFASFQAVFGNSDDVFENTSLILPLKAQDVTAKILFDSYKDKEVRGGRRPFVVTFIVPAKFIQSELYQFNKLQEQIVDAYASSKSKDIKLKDYFEHVLEDTGKIAQKVNLEGDSSFKKKDFEEAAERYRDAQFLFKITKDTSFTEETGKKLAAALARQVDQMYGQASEKIKQQDHAGAEKDFLVAGKLAAESKNEKMIKQCAKTLNDFYRSWIKKLDKDAKEALKESDTKTASKLFTKLIKIAKKLEEEKIVAKYEAELANLPSTKKQRVEKDKELEEPSSSEQE